MTQQASAPAAPASPGPSDNGTGVTVGPSLEERSAAAFGLSDPAAEAGTPALPDASTAGSVDLDAAATARAERRAKLDQLRNEERGRVDAMAAIRERDELRAKLATLEASSKESAGRVDPRKLTKAEFFALAEQNPDLTPHELGEWLRERMANPELAAANAAQRAVDPKLSALEQKLADQQKVIDSFLQSQESAKEEAAEAAAARELFAFTTDNAATSPYSARFLAKHGEGEFLKLAQRAVQDVPPGAGAQAILDEIEENLAQLGHIYTADPATPQRRQAPPQSQYVAAQTPTTVSNTLAQGRSSVVDEDESWAALPFEERSARLFR